MSDLSASSPLTKWSEEWWATRSPQIQERRCKAHKKTGERCKQAAMEAQQVCGYHGGRAPQNKRKARQRIDEAADRLAKKLIGIALDDNTSEGGRIAAIKDLLDRAGVSAKTAIDVEVEVKPYQRLTDKIVGIGTMSREESRARRGFAEPPALDSQGHQDPQNSATSAPSDGEIVDAEIVDDPTGEPAHSATQTSPGRPAGMRTDDDAGNPPGKGLMPYEDALVLANKINRRAGVYGRRRR